jgi:predicted RNA binding protein with dsRBD fold (UPF0201 family)
MDSSVQVSIEVDGYEDAQRLAAAISLLAEYAKINGHADILEFAERAEESLQNLNTDITRFR